METRLDTSEILSSEATVEKGLEIMLCANEAELATVVNRIYDFLNCSLRDNQKHITRIEKKVKSWLTRQQTETGNTLEYLITRLLNWLTQDQLETEYLLQQLCVKCGELQVGEPLENAITPLKEEGSGIQYAGELVLSVREAIPYFVQLIEVLKEIRDRLTPVAIELPKELPASDEPFVAGTEAEEPYDSSWKPDWSYLSE